MLETFSTLVSRWWWAVILCWVVVAVGINHVAPHWDDVTLDGDVAYMPDRMTSVRAERRLQEAFPKNKSKSQVVLVAERSDGPLGSADLEVLDELTERFSSESGRKLGVVEVWDRHTKVIGEKLVSPPANGAGQASLILLRMSQEFMDTQNIALLETITETFAELKAEEDYPAGLQLGVTGSTAIGGDMLASAKESIDNTEVTTVALVLIILLIVYRSPLLVMIPLATIVVSVAVAVDLVALVTQIQWLNFQIFKTTKIFIIVVLFGAGTDYCLFLIARYREELERGLDKARALSQALTKVGDALMASALTTIFGLGMMFFADFGKFRNAGPTIAMCLAVALLASMTLAPALLRAAGQVVFWPSKVKVRTGERDLIDESGIWARVSRILIARPGLILVASLLLLLYPAMQGWDVRITYNLLNELQEDRPTVVGTNLVRKHFDAGDIGPLTMVVYDADARFDSREGSNQIAKLTKQLYDIDGVQSVRSLTSPLGEAPRRTRFSDLMRRRRILEMTAKETPRARDTYLSQSPRYAGTVTRLDLVLRYDPFSSEATDLLDLIDDRVMAAANDPTSLWHEAEFDFAGTTAAKRDLEEVTASDQILIQMLVVIAVYAVLILILRRPFICGYLILSVLLSYFVTIGITETLFAWYYAETFDGLDWKVPIFLFVILVAVGEDYNIYLVTRVFEEQKKHGQREGLRLAVVRTGGIITSCGLIMAGTFCSMMTGTLRGMLELGFALSFGVLLDTFIVRPILVPAFLALFVRDEEDSRGAPTAVETAEREVAAPQEAAHAKVAAPWPAHGHKSAAGR